MSYSVIHDMIIALRDDICLTVSYTYDNRSKRRYMSHSVIHDMIIALRDDIFLTVSYTI